MFINDSLYDIKEYTDQYGNLRNQQRPNKPFQVIGRKIETGEILVQLEHVYIDNLYEIPYQQQITEANQFRVDYKNGTIYFHASQEGQYLNLSFWASAQINYKAINSVLIDAANNYISNNVEGALIEIANRIANLILNTSSPAEVTDAHYDSVTNTIYTTLKQRLDQHSEDISNLSDLLQDTITDTLNKFNAFGINIENFGAAENADSTTAIQSAINSFNSTKGGVIFIPCKTYLTGEIDITGKNVTFVSFGGTLKLKNNANTSLLWVKTGADNFKIMGQLNFDGNASNQTHTINVSTPFNTNSALVLIQSNDVVLENVVVQNTKLRGLMVCANTDTSPMINKPIINNCKAYNTMGDGIITVFARQPEINNCIASQIGGKFIQVVGVNNTIKAVQTASSFTHIYDNRIACFRFTAPMNRPVYIGSVTKGDDIDGQILFNIGNIALYGGSGNISYWNDLYLLSAENGGHGIIASNCDDAKINNCIAEYTSYMGIAIVQDRGSNGIISNCTTICTGDEGQCLDGCRAGSIDGGTARSCSINSNAPDFHIANASPGVSDPYANSIVNCKSYNGLSKALINAGLYSSVAPSSTLINGNYIYRNPSYNWDSGAWGIQANGISTITSNTIEYVDNGIIAIGGDTPKIKANTLIGNDATTSVGVRSNNSGHTIISNNDIQHFNVATSSDGQGGYKINGNNILNCVYALDTTFSDSETAYVGNLTYSTNLFKNAIPDLVDDTVFNYHVTLSDINYARTTYSTPLTFTTPSGGYLKVIADGNLAYPSEKIYRIFKYNNVYYMSGISTTEQDPTVITSTVAINQSTGVVTIVVGGNGGGKAVSYMFSPNMF